MKKIDNIIEEIGNGSKIRGITLITLVVTMIVLIILAAVIINLSLGNNGIFNRAKTAKEKYQNAEIYEQTEAEIATNKIDGQISGSNRETVASANPTGTIISFLGNPGTNNADVPEGYLACDGKTYNIADYPELADQIEKTLGSKGYYGGDGTTTFAVPNLQGEFLRGYSTGSSASKTSGVTTADVGKHQNGTLLPYYYAYYNSSTSYGIQASYNQYAEVDKYVNVPSHRDVNAGGAWTGIESDTAQMMSRPTNTSVLYCIKY